MTPCLVKVMNGCLLVDRLDWGTGWWQGGMMSNNVTLSNNWCENYEQIPKYKYNHHVVALK